ncbi:MAG: diiron oxygenase, partial [Polyangiales bacterium]
MASHHALLARLNLQSVKKHHDAYADIAWEPIDPTDPRFERPGGHGLGRTAWYRALPAASRARMGLHLAMAQMRIGI